MALYLKGTVYSLLCSLEHSEIRLFAKESVKISVNHACKGLYIWQQWKISFHLKNILLSKKSLPNANLYYKYFYLISYYMVYNFILFFKLSQQICHTVLYIDIFRHKMRETLHNLNSRDLFEIFSTQIKKIDPYFSKQNNTKIDSTKNLLFSEERKKNLKKNLRRPLSSVFCAKKGRYFVAFLVICLQY